MYHSFLNHSSADGHLCPSYCKQCCDEHWGTHVSFPSGFLSVYTQQIKELDKCPPNQKKEEEIGNLPDKEFRIMIVKLIQNLEIKMVHIHNAVLLSH